MEPGQIESILNQYMDQNGWQSAAMDENLFEAGYIDSITMVDFLVYIESNFAIEFAPAEVSVQNFSSLKTIADMIQNKMK